MWHTHAMPVHGRFLGKAVLYLDPHALALTDPDFRAWNGPSARNRARFTRPNGVHFGGACTADPLDLIRERMGAAIGIAMKRIGPWNCARRLSEEGSLLSVIVQL